MKDPKFYWFIGNRNSDQNSSLFKWLDQNSSLFKWLDPKEFKKCRYDNAAKNAVMVRYDQHKLLVVWNEWVGFTKEWDEYKKWENKGYRVITKDGKSTKQNGGLFREVIPYEDMVAEEL